jgi:rod shape-determining protein MreC
VELFLHRYRHLTVLVAAIVAQLVLLAYQVRSNGEVRLIRVWAVSAVTPLAKVIERGRASAAHFFRDYFVLLDVREENRRLRADLDRAHMENHYLRTELSTADRARSLAIFQQRSPSKTVAAHVIGNTTAAGAKVVIVDRGSSSGVQKGMAVITPDGIAGKVILVYRDACLVRLITDSAFAAGVISAKHRVRGTVRGQGHSTVLVDHIQNEQTVEQGEWFFTSGDDLIFPKGWPVGQATVVKPGAGRKDVYLTPAGLQNGLEEVFVIIEGVHVEIPGQAAPHQPVHVQPPPAEEAAPTEGLPPAPIAAGPTTGRAPGTDADRLLQQYRKIGEAQNHVYGAYGQRVPNFNLPPAALDGAPAPSTRP